MLFSLELPIPLHTAKQIKFLAALLGPIALRLPFHWIYPVGEKQEYTQRVLDVVMKEAGL